jgi:hypothetical protein
LPPHENLALLLTAASLLAMIGPWLPRKYLPRWRRGARERLITLRRRD